MILNKIHNNSSIKYQWNDMNNQPVSPEYEDIEQALKWIKEHDESKETNQKVI